MLFRETVAVYSENYSTGNYALWVKCKCAGGQGPISGCCAIEKGGGGGEEEEWEAFLNVKSHLAHNLTRNHLSALIFVGGFGSKTNTVHICTEHRRRTW
jgi:hypothetical protein